MLHFIHSLVSGGAEKQLGLLASGLDTSKFDVAVFCADDSNHNIDISRVQIIKSTTKKVFSPDFFKSIYRAIKIFDPHVIHVWLPASVSIPSLFFGWLMRKPVIFSYRNKMYFHRGLSFPEFVSVLLFSKKIISNHDIVDSNFLYKWLYKIKNGQVISNAVVVPNQYLESRSVASPGENMIFVGRLSEQKNPTRLVRALSGIDANLNWHLDIYGEGELRSEIEELVESLDLSSKISIHGYSTEIYSALQEASLLLFPSIKEGMPNVLVEAMAIGTPVMASDIAGNRSIFGADEMNCIAWVDPYDEKNMRETIEKLINGSYELNDMTARATLVVEKFSLEVMLENYEQSYRELVGI